MDIFVYSDESGVFDVVHNDFYVFGGVLFLSKADKDNVARKYRAIEKNIRNSENLKKEVEVKATSVRNKSKGKLYRGLNNCEKFGVIINQNKVHKNIFQSKKHKQRYLDYAYKIAIKRKFEHMIVTGQIDPLKVENIYFCVDEHTTATNGLYELRESMLQEFKDGMFTSDFVSFKEPIFPNLKTLDVKFCNSSKNTLVRAADIVANKLYYATVNANLEKLNKDKFNIIRLPWVDALSQFLVSNPSWHNKMKWIFLKII